MTSSQTELQIYYIKKKKLSHAQTLLHYSLCSLEVLKGKQGSAAGPEYVYS